MDTGNIVDFLSRRDQKRSRIVRIAPENDGLRALYSNDRHPDHLVSVDIIGWALLDSGDVTALVPWLKDVTVAAKLADPLNGHCEGYWDPHRHCEIGSAPPHKVAELRTALEFFGPAANDHRIVVQSIPDAPGTHAVLTGDDFSTIRLLEVHDWQLRGDGAVLAMLTDFDRVTDTPVRSGDDCLYPAQEHPHFRYFFQHAVANQIKRQDPEAMACLAMLMKG